MKIKLHPFWLEEQQQIKYAMYIIGFQKMKALEFMVNMISIGALSLPNVERTTSKFNNLIKTIYPLWGKIVLTNIWSKIWNLDYWPKNHIGMENKFHME